MSTKIKAKNQWDVKYLREQVWMPFGSMCHFMGEALQGQQSALDEDTFERLARKAFELSMEFTKEAYSRTYLASEKDQDLPTE